MEVANGIDSGGIDTVRSGLNSYTLGAGVENLIFTGTGAFRGTGNELGNSITGGLGADEIFGLDGNDTLLGGGGNDTIWGGAGADRMTGGAGFDRFVIAKGEALGDVITDFAGNGAKAGDELALKGWGAGTTITRVDGSTNQYVIYDPTDNSSFTITISGTFSTANDWLMI
jgi:Ca2+-binding RTX toxin-like protein